MLTDYRDYYICRCSLFYFICGLVRGYYKINYCEFNNQSTLISFCTNSVSLARQRCTATPCFALYELFDFAFNIGLSDTAVMDMMVSTLQQQRAVTEQLRREAAIKRVPVSVAIADIIKYINEHEQEDCLLVGFSSQKVNPFREKSSCTVL